jgi:FkbM family methyltransferase
MVSPSEVREAIERRDCGGKVRSHSVGMKHRMEWLVTRPRAVLRSMRKVGLRTTLKLALIRIFGSPDRSYQVRLPCFRHPVWMRGGKRSDGYAIYELVVRGEYEFMGRLDSPRFIIDGGANIGIASLLFLHQYPEARVLAVEPDPGNFEICSRNLGPYKDRARVVHGAIWSAAGKLTLASRNGEDWTKCVHAPGTGDVPTVDAFTMTSLIADETVDLLKLDVEGAEREIFSANAERWLPSVRNVVIELHGGDCEASFFGALSRYQYDLIRSGKNALPVLACRNLRAAA